MALLRRIERCSSAQLLEKILEILLPEARDVLDVTYGRGNFWTPEMTTRWRVYGYDLDPTKGIHGVHDFTKLPDPDKKYCVGVFDPPYQTDAGEDGLVQARFGSYPTVPELREAVTAGVREAWRVSSVGIVVKVMPYIHASRLVRMERWVEDAVPVDLYDFIYLESPSKPEDPEWQKKGPQLSVRSNATVWLVFRHKGQTHSRRKALPPAVGAVDVPSARRFRRLASSLPPSGTRRVG